MGKASSPKVEAQKSGKKLKFKNDEEKEYEDKNRETKLKGHNNGNSHTIINNNIA